MEDHPDPWDGMGRIPDEILKTHILSRLSMKEAVRTSVVSSEWKSLWKSYGGGFEFYDIQTKVDIYCRKKDFDEELKNYMNWVDKVLLVSASPAIKQLKVCFDLNKDHAETIDKWIRFVMVRKIEMLDLDLSPMMVPGKSYYRKERDVMYKFPNPDWFLNLEALSYLRLHSVDISGEDVIHILSNSPLLETLSISATHSLENLKINSSSSVKKLKCLEIISCFGLKNVEVIGVKNLASFTYNQEPGEEILTLTVLTNMVFGDVGKLSSFCIGAGGYCKQILISGFKTLPFPAQQLRKLSLDMRHWSYPSIPISGFKKLRNLVELQLAFQVLKKRNLVLVTRLLRACPNIHILVVKYNNIFSKKRRPPSIANAIQILKRRGWLVEEEEEEEPKTKGKRKYKYLKEVQLLGWRGLLCEIQFVNHLIRGPALSLETLTIDPRNPFITKDIFRRMNSTHPTNNIAAAHQDARIRATHLKSTLPTPPTTKFKWVIL